MAKSQLERHNKKLENELKKSLYSSPDLDTRYIELSKNYEQLKE